MARKGASQTLDLPLPQLSRVCHVSGVGYLTDEAVRDVAGTRIAFLERTGGVSAEPHDSLNLGLHVDDDPACVRENRLRALAALGAGACAGHLLACNQVHGSDVVVVEGQEQHVRERLAEHHVDAALIDQFVSTLDDCEFARYAPGDPAENMEKTYASAEYVISQMEKSK